MRKSIVVAFCCLVAACAEPTSVTRHSADLSVKKFFGAAAPEAALPSGYATMMGTISQNFPHSSRNLRYQQVFMGSNIVDPTIVGMCLRRNDPFGTADRVKTLTVRLGPTTLDYTNLGATFDANYSAPPTEVFSGEVTVPATAAGGEVGDFDFCIPFTQEYTHTSGSNVILEVVNTSATTNVAPRDACADFQPECTTSQAFAQSSAATVATSVLRGGLIVKFVSPEPPKPVDPAEKEECFKGGWSTFHFKNQGQCVRFVETGEDSRG